METKFTKGEWEVEYDNSETHQWYNAGPAKIEFGWNEETKEAEANAKLIAAAPELLDALIELREKTASLMANLVDSPMEIMKDITENELNKFYDSIDFNYDSGFGGQELFGTAWLDDGTWLSRGEYDGSEWWEHNVLPEIPSELL